MPYLSSLSNLWFWHNFEINFNLSSLIKLWSLGSIGVQKLSIVAMWHMFEGCLWKTLVMSILVINVPNTNLRKMETCPSCWCMKELQNCLLKHNVKFIPVNSWGLHIIEELHIQPMSSPFVHLSQKRVVHLSVC